MKVFKITGFTKWGVWTTIEVKTIKECINKRALEKGIINITHIEEI